MPTIEPNAQLQELRANDAKLRDELNTIAQAKDRLKSYERIRDAAADAHAKAHAEHAQQLAQWAKNPTSAKPAAITADTYQKLSDAEGHVAQALAAVEHLRAHEQDLLAKRGKVTDAIKRSALTHVAEHHAALADEAETLRARIAEIETTLLAARTYASQAQHLFNVLDPTSGMPVRGSKPCPELEALRAAAHRGLDDSYNLRLGDRRDIEALREVLAEVSGLPKGVW